MIKNPALRSELAALARAEDWAHLRSWFSYWKTPDEQVDKFILWAHFFLPHYFRDPTPPFHRNLARRYFSKRNEYTAAPRGFSKTTLLQAGILFDCVNELEEFIALVEKTFTEGSEVLEAVRNECVSNEMLIKVYGDLLQNEKSLILSRAAKAKDAEGDLFINGVRLRAKGFDQPIRGLKSREWRPTKIILDDVEQDQHINNPEQRAKYESNYNKGIQPAVDRDGHIKVFGTILHMDSLLSNLIKLHDGRIFRAYYLPSDAQYWVDAKPYTTESIIDAVGPVRLLWESRWSWQALMRKKADMISKNQSSNAFEQEYRNNPIAEEERKFKWEWLYDPDRSIKMSELMKKGLTLVGYAAIDCADSKNEGSDSTAAVVILVDQHGNWYRVDVRNEKRNIKELLDLIFDIWQKWSRKGLVKIGIEKKAFADQVVPLLEAEIGRRKIYPVVEELKPMGRNKEDRIMGALQGRYEYGKIWTVIDDVTGRPVGNIDPVTAKTATETLLEQLYNFPSSDHDDISDAEAYISDIVSVPNADENRPSPHRDPSDDPWRGDRNTNVMPDDDAYGGQGGSDDRVDTDEDPY